MKRSPAFVVGFILAVWAGAAFSEDIYKDAVMADKPFAYYRLDEDSNQAAVGDEIGNNPGAFVNEPEVGVGGAILTDPKDKAVLFARVKNQYIKLTTFAKYGIGISSGFTVECWLKTANSKDHQNVLGTANPPIYLTNLTVDIAYEGVPGRLRIFCRDDHSNRFGADFYPRKQNFDIYDDQWHHVVYVYDPESHAIEDQVKLYIDSDRQEVSVWHKGSAPKLADFTDPMTLGTMNLRGDMSDSLDGALDEVAFYPAALSADQIAKHYLAAGYKKRERPKRPEAFIGFPMPTPVTNANPSVRHEVTVEVPTKFTVQRQAEQMIVTVDRTDSKTEKMTVGENMVTGMEYDFVAYPKGDPAPAKSGGFAMTSRIDFVGANRIFNRKFGGVPEEGKAYEVEMRWKIFETDIPPQHMWGPQGKKYKVILEGTVKQTVE